MSRKTKILFVHGLESNENGIKVQILKSVASFDVHCPRMPCAKNIWHSFALIVRELRVFQPDIIVASSYGTILTLLLIQMGVWTGRTILLATAMHVFAPFRLLPIQQKELVLIVHGNRDIVCPIQPIRRWAAAIDCEFLELDDVHCLKTLTDDRAPLIKLVFEQMRLLAPEHCTDHSKSLAWMLVKLTGIVCKAALYFVKRKILFCVSRIV